MDGLVIAAQIILAVTGLIGTVGGLVISYLTLRRAYAKDALRIKLKLDKRILITPVPGKEKPNFSEEMLTFSVANHGKKPYTIAGLGLQIGKRSGGLWINQPFGTVTIPYELTPDNTCNFWTEFIKVEKKAKKESGWHRKIKIRAYTQDYLGNNIYSNWMVITFNETAIDKTAAHLKEKLHNILRFFRP